MPWCVEGVQAAFKNVGETLRAEEMAKERARAAEARRTR